MPVSIKASRASNVPTYVTSGVEVKADDYTVTAADSGKTLVMNGDDKTFTLPATVDGLTYTFVVGATSTSVGLSVSPNADDQLIGNGFTALDDKDAINTQATERVGDAITVVGDGSAGWYITNVEGTWAREA